MSPAEAFINDAVIGIVTIMLIAVGVTYLLIPIGATVDWIKSIRYHRRMRESDRRNRLRIRERNIARIEKELGMYIEEEGEQK